MTGHAIGASDLFAFVKAYVRTFKEADVFPEARTLLAATAEANNRNACDAALRKYKREMDQHVDFSFFFGPFSLSWQNY